MKVMGLKIMYNVTLMINFTQFVQKLFTDCTLYYFFDLQYYMSLVAFSLDYSWKVIIRVERGIHGNPASIQH